MPWFKKSEVRPPNQKELTDPGLAYYYALIIREGRFPEAEEVIATDAKWAYEYAKDIIKGRWLAGEDVIGEDGYFAYRYAVNVLMKRFPEGEQAIAMSLNKEYYETKFDCNLDNDLKGN